MKRPENPDAKTREAMRRLHAVRVKILALPLPQQDGAQPAAEDGPHSAEVQAALDDLSATMQKIAAGVREKRACMAAAITSEDAAARAD